MVIKDLLKLENFKKYKFLKKDYDLNKNIDNIFILNDIDTNLKINENSIILIDFSNFQQKLEFYLKFIEDNLNKISVICLKTFNLDFHINDMFIEKISNYSIPIMIFQNNINIIKIKDEILSGDLELRINTYHEKENLYRKVMRLIMIGSGVESIVNLLSDFIDRDILLLDYYYNTIYSTSDKISVKIQDNLENNIENLNIYMNNRKVEKESCVVQKIFSKDIIFGYITIFDTDTLSFDKLNVIEQFSLMFAIFFYKNDIVLEREKRIQENLLLDIIEGKITYDRDIIEAENRVNLKMKFPQFIYLLEFKNSDFLKLAISKLEYNYRNKGMLLRFIVLEKIIIIFVNKEYKYQLDNSIEEFIKKGYLYSVGISSLIKSIKDYKRAYEQAKISSYIGKSINKNDIIFNYDDYFIYRLISEVKNQNILMDMIEDKFGKLLQEKDSETLLITLMSLINNNFNRKDTAKELYIHYNTLLYRIKKLKELEILNDDSKNLSDYVLCFYIYKWLNR